MMGEINIKVQALTTGDEELKQVRKLIEQRIKPVLTEIFGRYRWEINTESKENQY
jgi:hypothetical protein